LKYKLPKNSSAEIKVGFVSLGCHKNLVDTEMMIGKLLDEKAVKLTNDPREARVIVVNTCGFIDSAKEESITTILQMAEYKKKGQCRGLIVTGCLAQRYAKELWDECPEIDALLGTNAWEQIPAALEAVLKGERLCKLSNQGAEPWPAVLPARFLTTSPHSVYLKISEGCDNRCSYCVIPDIRGPLRSRTMSSIAEEARTLAAQGAKELNVIAQDTTSYGRDLFGQPKLPDLLRLLIEVPGIKWVRLLYCYPRFFTDELIELFRTEPKICRYIDLPMQHAHDEILKKMNRPERLADLEALLAKIRRHLPDVAIRTTFIVGFPGETDEHYLALRNFVAEQKFDHLGVYTYSREEGTPAAAMPDQVPDQVKEERYHDLMSLQAAISEEKNSSWVGKVLPVLVESVDASNQELTWGRSYREAPEVDGRVYLEGAAHCRPGEFIQAKIVQAFAYDLLAEAQDPASNPSR